MYVEVSDVGYIKDTCDRVVQAATGNVSTFALIAAFSVVSTAFSVLFAMVGSF